jgi:hypothetical protein
MVYFNCYRDFVLTAEIALVLVTGMPLRSAFDLEVLRLLQSGVPSVWEKRVMTATPERNMAYQGRQTRPSGPVPLSLAHLGGPFILLGIGLTLACITLSCERVAPTGKISLSADKK